jgi:hypothetical protein
VSADILDLFEGGKPNQGVPIVRDRPERVKPIAFRLVEKFEQAVPEPEKEK